MHAPQPIKPGDPSAPAAPTTSPPHSAVSTQFKFAALGLLAVGTAAFGLAGPKIRGALGIGATQTADLSRPPVKLDRIKGPLATGGGLGINLVYQAYWSSQFAFVDLLAQSSEWLPQEVEGWTWDTGQPLELSPDGWPLQLAPGQAAGKLMARGLGGNYPGGLYHLEWDGIGTWEVLGDGKIVNSQTYRHAIRVTPTDGGLHIKLTSTKPKDPVRNVRLVRDGHRKDYLEQPFAPEFLEWLEPFDVLRFMDWQRTNDSTQTEWGQRVLPGQDTQSGPQGVALEYCIALGNALEKDIWLCVPHLADDDYVRQMAELVHESLDKDLVCHVEFSNEVWNSQFSQAQWSEREGLKLKLSENPFQARLLNYARRSTQVFELWRDVFGKSAKSRLVCVLAGQAVNPWTAEVILGAPGAAEQADAYAVAPYFGSSLGSPENAARTKSYSTDQLFEALDQDLTKVLDAVHRTVKVAADHDLPLIAYEAGQHLAGHGGVESDDTQTARFKGANRDPRMGELYTRLLETWATIGGRTICMWNSIETWSKWGSWGLVEFLDTPREKAPKLDATLDFAEQRERWW